MSIKKENSRICFLARKPHIDGLYKKLSEHHVVDGIEYAGFGFPPIPSMNIHKVEYTLFGLQKIMVRFGLENQLPIHIKGLQTLLRDINPDKLVIFDFYHLYFLQALWYKIRSAKETELFVYSETKRLPRNPISKLIFFLSLLMLRNNIHHVKKVLVYTDDGKDFLGKYIEQSKIETLPAPVDSDFFSSNPDRTYMDDGALRLLMNARFVPYKRHIDLLKALKILKERSDLRLTLSLVGRSGGYETTIRKYISMLGLEAEVSFLPSMKIEQVRNVYREHDILILPSYNEAIGMVVPEAMSCGVPTITSDTVGANVYVRPGKTGFVFKTGDALDLARSIEAMATRETLNQMGRAARKTIEDHYSLEKITESFETAVGLASFDS